MTRTDRRRCELVAGNDEKAVPRAPGRVSRGGIALRADCSGDVGIEVELELPGADGGVSGRVVAVAEWTGLAFRQDEATLRRIDQAMARIGIGKLATAA